MGNFYVANYGGTTVSKVTPAGVVSTFATGLNNPFSLAFDSSGNLFVANVGSNTVSEVTPAGVVSTFATGFNGPQGLAFDAAGNLFVANAGVNTVSEVTPAGVVSTFASGFNAPQGLAFDASGNLFVANAFGNTVSEVTPAGVVSTFASGFNHPEFVIFDGSNLLVSNLSGGSVSEVTPQGVVSTYVSGFNGPVGLDFDAAGNLFVSNFNGGSVSSYGDPVTVPFTLGGTATAGTDYSGVTSPLTFAPGQSTATITGTLLSDLGANQTLTFTLDTPTGASLGSPAVNTLTIDEQPPTVQFSTGSATVNASAGTFSIPVTLTDTASTSVTVPFTLGGTAVSGTDYSGVTTSPLTFAPGQTTATITGTLSSDPGVAQTLTVTLDTPTGASLGSPAVNTLTIDEPATVQFSAGSETVNESTGTFSIPVTLLGTPSGGTPTVSTFASGFSTPNGLVTDTADNLYVANFGNNTLSKVTPAGAITTFATGLNQPQYLALDAVGNLFVSNYGDNTVSKVTPAGVVSTFATGFADPEGLVVNSAGNLFVANFGAGTVSEVTPAGVVSTFASGFSSPTGLAFDAAGNLFVANYGAGTVSEVTPAGVVSIFATGFSEPAGLAFDAAGNLFVANNASNTVSKVTPGGVVSTFASGFSTPVGLAIDATGNLFASSAGNGTVSALGYTVTVPFALSGTAVSGTDYSGVSVSPLTFAPGQTTATITGTLLDNGYTPTNNTLVFTLGTPTNANLGSQTSETLTINSDPEPTVQFATTSQSVNASAGTFSVTVTLSAVSTVATTIPFNLSGTAVNGTDYSNVTVSPLVIAAGQTSATITGTLLDHGYSPTNNTLVFTLGTPTNANPGSQTSETLTIDSDPEPTVQFATTSQSVNASGGHFQCHGHAVGGLDSGHHHSLQPERNGGERHRL